MNSNAHFEYVRHKYLIKLISWVAVYLAFICGIIHFLGIRKMEMSFTNVHMDIVDCHITGM